MANPKCVHCDKKFKSTDEILTVDSVKNHVHIECHYDYLSEQHLNFSYTLQELKEALEEEY